MDWKHLGQVWQKMFAELWEDFYMTLNQFKSAFLVMLVYVVFAVVLIWNVAVSLSVPLVVLAIVFLMKFRHTANSNLPDDELWWGAINWTISIGGYIVLLMNIGDLPSVGVFVTHIAGLLLYYTIPEPKLLPPTITPQIPPQNISYEEQNVPVPPNYGETHDLSR